MVSQDKSQGLAFIFKSSERKILLSATPWIKIIHFFLHRNLNRGSRWYLTTWRTTRFFFLPLWDTAVSSQCITVHMKGRQLKRQHLCFSHWHPKWETYFRWVFFTFCWLHLNGFHEARGKKKRFKFGFLECFVAWCRLFDFTHTQGPYWAYVWFYENFSLQILLHQGLWTL